MSCSRTNVCPSENLRSRSSAMLFGSSCPYVLEEDKCLRSHGCRLNRGARLGLPSRHISHLSSYPVVRLKKGAFTVQGAADVGDDGAMIREDKAVFVVIWLPCLSWRAA